jgi:hypothetical protein
MESGIRERQSQQGGARDRKEVTQVMRSDQELKARMTYGCRKARAEGCETGSWGEEDKMFFE